jgi:hypothetical protein
MEEILEALKKHDIIIEKFECRKEIHDGLCLSIESRKMVSGNQGEWYYVPEFQIIITEEGKVLGKRNISELDPLFKTLKRYIKI